MHLNSMIQTYAKQESKYLHIPVYSQTPDTSWASHRLTRYKPLHRLCLQRLATDALMILKQRSKSFMEK